MRKEEIIKITNKELVNKLGTEQLEWFRKKIYKYRSGDLLFYDVEFRLLSEIGNVSANIAGRYIFEEETEKTEETHKIYISDKQLDEYKNNYFAKNYRTKFLKNEVINTIRHEILHAYVKERFLYFCKVKNYECDASIIFLMHLQFFKVGSGHDCASAYRYSKMHKRVRYCKDYDEFLILVSEVIIRVNKLQRVFKEKYINEGKSVGLMFGDKNSSMCKFINNKSKYIVKDEQQELMQMNVEVIDFILGSTTDIDSIESLIDKKLNNREDAVIREIKKIYMKKVGEKIYSKEIMLDRVY